MAKKKEEPNNKPAFEARLNHVRVSVWKNSGESGEWFNTVISRRYKDGEDWKDSNTFNGLADLALVAECARLARDFIADNALSSESMEA